MTFRNDSQRKPSLCDKASVCKPMTRALKGWMPMISKIRSQDLEVESRLQLHASFMITSGSHAVIAVVKAGSLMAGCSQSLDGTWRPRGLSKSVISRVIVRVTPFRVLITLLITHLLSPRGLQVL